MRLSESVKARVAEGIQYLYNETDSPGFADTTRSITDDLMRAISDNDAIAVDISTLKISDEYTFKHSVDVATMSMIVAKSMVWTIKPSMKLEFRGFCMMLASRRSPMKC